jgi:hypothetical protein
VRALAATAALAACSSPSSGPAATAVVVGLQGEDLSGAVGTVHVVTTLGAATFDDETLAPSALPHEVRVAASGGGVAAPIGVRVDGYAQAGWTPASAAPPVLVRTARTQFVANETRLLRMLLQGDCVLAPPGSPLPGGPVCMEPETCINRACASDVVSPQALEPYASGWPNNAPDVCRPANAGAPVIQVGTGQTDFLPIVPGETVQAEQGPQGGHHIWIAVRQENLRQAGSVTKITSAQPSTGLAGPTMAFAFTFGPDQGGFCVLWGLRYQLDLDGTDYHLFLGKPLDITVSIQDQTGTTGKGTAHVEVAPDVLCANGTDGGC